MKVVGLDSKRKSCPFCGAQPACPDWTCKRLASVTVDEAGWSVEFVTTVAIEFQPVPPDAEPAN